MAKMGHEQVAHLIAVPHLLGHHPCQAPQVILTGRRVIQMALLLHRGKLRIPLIDDVVQERIADALVRYLPYGLPTALASKIPTRNGLTGELTILRLKGEASQMLALQTNILLPGMKRRHPIIKRGNCPSHWSYPGLGSAVSAPSRFTRHENAAYVSPHRRPDLQRHRHFRTVVAGILAPGP